MISANEARTKVTNAITDSALKQWVEIENKVNKAIKDNKFSITIDGNIIWTNKIKLEALGYKIISGSQKNEYYTCIEW